jgi:pSer/pThr/pTyr-binding forkhead associated (FHA) protein
MIACPNCSKENPDGFRFCQACGTPLAQSAPEPTPAVAEEQPTTCAKCNGENPAGMKFCKSCGSPLTTQSTLPAGASPTAAPASAPPAGPPPGAPAGGPPSGAPAGPPPTASSPGAASLVSCASCGGQTPSGYKFCQHCGAPLPTMQAPAAPPPSGPFAAPPMENAAAAPGSTPPTMVGANAPKDPAANTQSPSGGSVTGPPSDAGEGSAARTIIDMDGQMMAQQMSGQQPASPFEAPKHTPPAGMPPGQPPAISPDIDPDAATVPPQTDEQALGAGDHDRTIGPGAGVASPQAEAEELPVLARLVSVRRDGSDGEQTEVREEAFDIGRTEGQLQFGEDPYLAPRHCRLFLRDGAWVLQDLDTANGVYRRFTQPRPLEDGEQLLLGKQVLAFERLAAPEADLAPAVEHGVMIFGSPLKTPWGRLKQLTVAGIFRDVYHLHRPQVTFGREDGDVVFPDDEFMSRKHMAVSFVEEKVLVQDLGSSNGTFLKVSEVDLASGDLLRLGDQLLRFELA